MSGCLGYRQRSAGKTGCATVLRKRERVMGRLALHISSSGISKVSPRASRGNRSWISVGETLTTPISETPVPNYPTTQPQTRGQRMSVVLLYKDGWQDV